jgi:uncharacterized protein YqiB (DUF1249 family)
MPAVNYQINLAHQQAECALNYARLLRLLPQLSQDDNWLVGLPAGGRVRFTVKERGPYTTTLTIQAEHIWSTTECQVRAYHDAQMAEVVAFQGQWQIKPFNEYPNPAMHQIDEKAQWNLFLGEWLSHCLVNGHVEHDLAADADIRS